MYKIWLINLVISLFSILKVNALECVSVVNQKCMPRPKILDVNEGVGEALFHPYNVQINVVKVVIRLKILWLDYVFLISLKM